jgi:hypothetical protein
VLDTARLKYLIGKELNVDSRNIHASMCGEHDDSEFPVWSKAVVGDVFFKEYLKDYSKDNNETKLIKIFKDVRDSAYKIIEKKGETSYGIGLSLTKISKAILKNQNSILPVSSLLKNYYGINDLYLSVPAIVHRQGIRQVMKVGFGTLIGIGAAAVSSIRLGQKDYDATKYILYNVVILNIITGLLVTVTSLIFLKPILLFFGASANSFSYAYDFISIILLGNIITNTYLGLNSILRSTGHPSKAMNATIITILINLVLNYIFIFYFKLGIRGSACATVISQFIVLI